MNANIRDVIVVPEGDGVDVKRLFPLHDFMNVDPFVLWDHFNVDSGRGFPDHPHRGFEAITYMFEGGMNHKDNLGNESFVNAGGAQRFTAGSGLIHSEMPADTGNSQGIQLWINLPKKLKKIDPFYQQVNGDEFPLHKFDGGYAKIIVGEGSPIKLNTDVMYQHVSLQNAASYQLEVASQFRGLIYVMKGAVSVNEKIVNHGQALFIEGVESLSFLANSSAEFMICLGQPSGEKIHQHGPFVD